jgi:hypothetical protein
MIFYRIETDGPESDALFWNRREAEEARDAHPHLKGAKVKTIIAGQPQEGIIKYDRCHAVLFWDKDGSVGKEAAFARMRTLIGAEWVLDEGSYDTFKNAFDFGIGHRAVITKRAVYSCAICKLENERGYLNRIRVITDENPPNADFEHVCAQCRAGMLQAMNDRITAIRSGRVINYSTSGLPYFKWNGHNCELLDSKSTTSYVATTYRGGAEVTMRWVSMAVMQVTPNSLGNVLEAAKRDGHDVLRIGMTHAQVNALGIEVKR